MVNSKIYSPIEIVSREVSRYSNLEESLIKDSLKRILSSFMNKAMSALHIDPNSDDSLRCSQEYLVISELIISYGSTIATLEDMVEHEFNK